MSPARKKAKSARKSAPAKRPARKAGKPKAAKAKGKSTAPKGGKAAGAQRRRCIAQDPFGGPCQSAPRPGSSYCTIHSYLDR